MATEGYRQFTAVPTGTTVVFSTLYGVIWWQVTNPFAADCFVHVQADSGIKGRVETVLANSTGILHVHAGGPLQIGFEAVTPNIPTVLMGFKANRPNLNMPDMIPDWEGG